MRYIEPRAGVPSQCRVTAIVPTTWDIDRLRELYTRDEVLNVYKDNPVKVYDRPGLSETRQDVEVPDEKAERPSVACRQPIDLSIYPGERPWTFCLRDGLSAGECIEVARELEEDIDEDLFGSNRDTY